MNKINSNVLHRLYTFELYNGDIKHTKASKLTEAIKLLNINPNDIKFAQLICLTENTYDMTSFIKNLQQ